MITLSIDRGDLLFAIGDHDLTHYLDLQTGDVIPVFEEGVVGDLPDVDMDDEPERYRFIEPVPSSEGFSWMERFALAQEDGRTRRELLHALERRRPFRSFKDALIDFPEAREQWFAFEEQSLLDYARAWLTREGIHAELITPPAPPAI